MFFNFFATAVPTIPHRKRVPVRRAFTLIEMMVVLVLIGMLAAMVGVNVRHYLIKGKVGAAKVDIASIEHALATFYGEYGRYPTNEEGMTILTKKTDKVPEPLLNKTPQDPWSHPYQYLCPGRHGEPYEVICYGADGREGGTGADADLSSADDTHAVTP